MIVKSENMKSKKRILCFGTYHKTGTIWLNRILRQLAKETMIPMYGGSKVSAASIADHDTCIIFSDHSLFPQDILDRLETRLFHLIRDPRDMLISAVNYHQRAPEDREKWLHTPRAKLNNRSYKEHLKSLPTIYDKMLFEMDNSHRANMNLMLEWNYDNINCVEMKYEKLMADTTGDLFYQSLVIMGFSAEEACIGQRLFLESHVKNNKSSSARVDGHIRNSQTNWRHELPERVAKVFCERYGDGLIYLRYERDKSWINELTST